MEGTGASRAAVAGVLLSERSRTWLWPSSSTASLGRLAQWRRAGKILTGSKQPITSAPLHNKLVDVPSSRSSHALSQHPAYALQLFVVARPALSHSQQSHIAFVAQQIQHHVWIWMFAASDPLTVVLYCAGKLAGWAARSTACRSWPQTTCQASCTAPHSSQPPSAAPQPP